MFFRRLLAAAALVLLAAAVFLAGYRIADEMYLPGRIYLDSGDTFQYGGGLLTLRADDAVVRQVAAGDVDSYEASLCLFGTIPLKTVRVFQTEDLRLVPGGTPFGVKMFTSGVVVVGLGDVEGREGRACPAGDAGLQLGDIVLTVNGRSISGNEELLTAVTDSEGEVIEIRYLRDGEQRTARVKPVLSADGLSFRIGMWVRDSSAGIGTVTYYNPESGLVAGLGHGITDVDTGTVLPVESGELVPVSITGVCRGQAGVPGELKGAFLHTAPIARLLYNCESGVYAEAVREDDFACTALPVAYKQDVMTGAALVLCTVEGQEPQYYDIEIEEVRLSDARPTKNLVIRVTDRELLSATGGIVQGLSGSPIIQNGCIVGAVTHVFVNDPTKGYGIFIENMLFNESYAKAQQNVA